MMQMMKIDAHIDKPTVVASIDATLSKYQAKNPLQKLGNLVNNR